MANAKILIVEDSSIVALDIERSLRMLDYNVVGSVPTGEKAIEKAAELKPDLILMDIKLKGEIDGITAAEKIRSQINIPVIFLTAYSDEKTLERAKVTEPFGYLTKPFDERDLRITIEMAIYKFQMENKLKESENWLFTTLQSIGDGVIATDANGYVKFMNPVAEKLTGWEQAEALGKTMEEVFPIVNEKTGAKVVNPVERVIKEGIIIGLANHTILLNKNGPRIPIDDSAAPIINDRGTISGAVLVFRDVTDRKQAEEKMHYLSLHDSLTGLYNRTYFEEELRRINDRKFDSIGIISADIDGLKLINDTLGHNYGDSLLKGAAEVLNKSLSDEELIARMGGDEFAVLLLNKNRQIIEKYCVQIQENISNYNKEHSELPLSMSIGVATSDNQGANIQNLFKEADDNMYREKLYRSQSFRHTIVEALMKVLETKDFVTEGHVNRLQELVVRMANTINLPENNLTDLRLLAQFHDIGKVGIPDRVLFKPGSLTPDEQVEMRRHSELGYRIAQSVPELYPIADWILKHHEWWDGSGYPLGVKGEEIPLACRILAIADAYDAITSDRPYRKAQNHEYAIGELTKNAGTQFDPELVRRFLNILK